MDDVTAAYIAGVMDGEGCFRIERFATERSPIGFQYRSIVELTMCERDTVEFIAEKTGRNMRSKVLPSGKTAYILVWRNAFAANLLRAMLPYLRGKKEQAELCIHYEDNVAPGRGRTYTPEHAILCETLRDQVSALKRPVALRC